MNEIFISPSILSSDILELKKIMDKLVLSGIKMIHVDVMDGNFVKPISFGSNMVKSIRKHYNVFIDTHLMVKDPINQIEQFAAAGSDSITFHVESDCDIAYTIEKIKSLGVKAGLVVSPKTPIDAIFPYLEDIDMVLIMTVEPGYGGQGFMYEVLPKITALKKIITERNLNVSIQVDGGINEETAILTKKSGADNFVIGSYLICSDNITQRTHEIRELLNKY